MDARIEPDMLHQHWRIQARNYQWVPKYTNFNAFEGREGSGSITRRHRRGFRWNGTEYEAIGGPASRIQGEWSFTSDRDSSLAEQLAVSYSPNSLALSGDGRRLAIAMGAGGDDTIAAVDVFELIIPSSE